MTPDRPVEEAPERTVFAEPPTPEPVAPEVLPEPAASAPEESSVAEPERTSEPGVLPEPEVLPEPVASAPEESSVALPERTSEPEVLPEPVASAPEESSVAEPERTEPDPLPAPEPAVVPAPAAPQPVAGPWQPGPALLGVLGGVVALLVAAVVVLSVLAVTTSGPSGAEKDRRAALAASKAAAKLVFSYDYRHLPADFAKGKAVTTGAFAKEYQKTTSEVVSDVAPRYKTVVVADVSEAGVVRSSGRTVTVLMFVNQTSNSTLSKAPKITQSRVQMELTRTGGRWLVSKITAL